MEGSFEYKAHYLFEKEVLRAVEFEHTKPSPLRAWNKTLN